MSLQSLPHRWGIGAAGLGAAFVAGVLISGGGPALVASGPARVAATAVASAPPLAASPAPTSYADAVDRVTPSVVTIQVEKRLSNSPGDQGMPDDQFLQRFFGGNAPQMGRNRPAPVERGLGSGVIVSPEGNILTNNHVVDGTQTVLVTLSDGREFSAKVVGKDPQTDLAVVHIDAGHLPALPLADSDHVRVGDVVLAVGNPLGVGETVTMGIISAKGRTTATDDGAYEDFLQTDAPINQGNSGGALINTSGELVGINSQMMSTSGGSIGIGFAIPSNMAKNVMTQLVATGHVRRGLMGVSVQSITSDLAKSMDLPSVHGALVGSVSPDGPAARAGLRQGDVILKVNGSAIEDSNDLRNRISSMAPGSSVTVDFQRDGAVKNATVRLDEVSADNEQTGHQPAPAASGSELGLTLEALTPALAQRYNVPASVNGLIVTNVAADSAASRANIQVGDVLRQVNGQPMHATGDLARAVAARAGRPALAYVQRGDAAFYVALPARP